jgi:tol-pal system protein YbgF
MKKIVHRTLIATCMGCCLNWTAFAVAPVVDESENFALFDEQLAAAEQRSDALMQTQANATGAVFASEDAGSDDDGDGEIIIDGGGGGGDIFIPTSAENKTNDTIALAHEDTANQPEQDPTLLLNKLQGLQQELSELRGQLEVQTHALQTLKKQQLDFYEDLDKRLREGPNTAQNTTTDANHAKNTQQPLEMQPMSTAPRGNPADEQISYLAAYELVKNKEFDKAMMAMKSFIQQYPRGGYTANAHYWLGEVYMIKQAFPDAIQQFETVLNSFPSSSKSSASSLKLGYALAAAGQKEAARERLKAVVRDYPDTHAAQLATSKLETLRS